jgi:hypothetical protein
MDPPVDVLLRRRGETEAAVALGEVDPGQPVVVLAPPEGDLVDGPGVDVGEQLVDPLGDDGGGVGQARKIGPRSTS